MSASEKKIRAAAAALGALLANAPLCKKAVALDPSLQDVIENLKKVDRSLDSFNNFLEAQARALSEEQLGIITELTVTDVIRMELKPWVLTPKGETT